MSKPQNEIQPISTSRISRHPQTTPVTPGSTTVVSDKGANPAGKDTFAPQDPTTVTPEIDGKAIFTAAHDMLTNARSSVELEMYNFDGAPGQPRSSGTDWNAIDKLGGAEQTRLVGDMVSAARRGVDVRVILDASKKKTGGIDNQATADYLKANGVKVLNYPPDTVNIDHVKLLVVDDNKALIGGMNWSYHSPANHDADVLVTGAGAARLRQDIFEPDVAISGGKPQNLPPGTISAIEKDHTIDPYTTAPGVSTIKDALINDINGARQTIHAEMFCLTDPVTVQALKDAHARGVDVRMLLDPNEAKYSKMAAETLSAAGVPVRWYNVDPATRQMLHAKWGTIDGQNIFIGSANWTENGLGGSTINKVNHEADVKVNDAAATAVFDKQFAADWNNSSDQAPAVPGSPGSF